MTVNTDFMIVVGGVCGSGKSTLVARLKQKGYHAHAVAQEHSYAPKMYLMTRPNYVILLECSYDTVQKRRKVGWSANQLSDQLHRLRYMRENCNLSINTDALSKEEVLQQALKAISQYQKELEIIE